MKQTDLRKLLELYSVGESYRDELLALVRESKQKDVPQKAAADIPVATYVSAEAEAESLWNWEPQVVPGLLQTPEYARAEPLLVQVHRDQRAARRWRTRRCARP